MLTEQEERELKEQVTKLTEALKTLTTVPEARHVSTEDVHAGNVDLAEIASGNVIVDMPDPDEEKRKVAPKPNEIKKSDKRRIGAHIAEIARGEMVLVD